MRQPKSVYYSYQVHCDEMKERHPVPYLHFFRRLKKLCPGVHSKKINIGAGRLNYTHFPDLELCREHIEQRIKITIDWDQDEVPF